MKYNGEKYPDLSKQYAKFVEMSMQFKKMKFARVINGLLDTKIRVDSVSKSDMGALWLFMEIGWFVSAVIILLNNI